MVGHVWYEGNETGDVYPHPGAGGVDKFFVIKKEWGWKEYRFDFTDDYKAKYGRAPGNLRRIVVNAYQDTDFCDVYVDDIQGYGSTERLQVIEGDTTLSYAASGTIGSASFDTGWVPPGGVSLVEKWYFRLSMILGWEPFTEKWPLRYAVAWDPGEVYPGNKFSVYVAVKPYAPQQGAPDSLVSTISPLGPSIELKAKRCIANLPCTEFSVSPTDAIKAVDVRSREKAPLAGEKLLAQGDDVSIVDFGIPETPVSAGHFGGRPEVKVNGERIKVVYNLKLNGNGFKSGEVSLTRIPSSWLPSQWSDTEPGVQTIWVDVPSQAKPGDKLTLNIAGFQLNAAEYNRINLTLNVLGYELWSHAFDWNQVGNSNARSPEINIDLNVVSAPSEGGGGGGQPPEVCRFKLGSKSYTAGGKTYPMDVAPYVKNDRSYVSIRYLANALGVRDQDITWNPATKTAMLKKGDTTLWFILGSRVMKKQVDLIAPVTIQMDVAPEIRNGRLCLPARYVAEGFGFRVEWDPAVGAIILKREALVTHPVVSPAEAVALVRAHPAVKRYLERVKQKGGNPRADFDHEEGDRYIVHVYEVVKHPEGSHTATFGWFAVEKGTGLLRPVKV